MKRILCLSGGSSKGAWQAGVIEGLRSQGREYDYVVGTSVGAINGMGVSYLGKGDLYDLWADIKGLSSVMHPEFVWPWNFKGVLNFNPLRKLILKQVEGKSPKIPAYASVVSMKTGKLMFVSHVEAPKLDDQIEAVLASSSMFGFHRPYMDYCFDGGHVEFVPLSKALDLQEETGLQIDVISTAPQSFLTNPGWKPFKYFPFLSMLYRFGEIVTDEVARNDIDWASDLPNVNLYAPESPIDLGGIDFDPEKIRQYLKMGFEFGLRAGEEF